MATTYAFYSSKSISTIFRCSDDLYISIAIYSCHSLDQMGVYETALERKDLNYAIIMRSVKMITNFARTGWNFTK